MAVRSLVGHAACKRQRALYSCLPSASGRRCSQLESQMWCRKSASNGSRGSGCHRHGPSVRKHPTNHMGGRMPGEGGVGVSGRRQHLVAWRLSTSGGVIGCARPPVQTPSQQHRKRAFVEQLCPRTGAAFTRTAPPERCIHIRGICALRLLSLFLLS